jgi:tryptophanyl-tRNA synthetase
MGNYLGAFRNWVAFQEWADAYYCIVDLHALTVDHDPEALGRRTLEMAALLIAVGIDPAGSTLFVQSHVPEHTELCWLLECTATMGELNRMVQFKEKGRGNDSVKVGLFTYPVLMAADILVYRAEQVPVGDDQRQHLELARDLAVRFNGRYGDTFVVPEAVVPEVGARVMDLQDPTSKMSKSSLSPQGTLLLLDEPAVIEKKIRRAVTDAGSEVVYDPINKPGVANLLELLGAATGRSPEKCAGDYQSYGALKADTAAAVVEMVSPIQRRFSEVSSDRSSLEKMLASGAERAREVAAATVSDARAAVGLLPPTRR